MEWSEYARRFKIACSRLGITQDDIPKYLDYGNRLATNGFPVIWDNTHFSKLVGFDLQLIYAIANSPKSFYRSFSIKKRSGKKRVLFEPYPTLKEIQKWILEKILINSRVSVYAKAYVRGQSVVDNARFHKNQPVVVKLDVRDFFGSIGALSITYCFRSMGYSKPLSTLFTKLVCLVDKLPQGAPTSPMLSNIFAYSIDQSLGTFAIRRKYRYTRYSDDITFSGSLTHGDIGRIIVFVRKVFRDHGLMINRSKTRVLRKSSAQSVTGIIVNEKLSVQRSVRKKVRQEIYYIHRFGIDSHIAKVGIEKANYLNHLRGKVNWILRVDPRSKEFQKYREFLLQDSDSKLQVEGANS